MIERLLELADRLITHDRDTDGDFGRRTVIHAFAGYGIIILALAHWCIPLALTVGFIFYEKNEDLHVKDQAWKDTFGFLVGGVMAGFTILGLKLSGVL